MKSLLFATIAFSLILMISAQDQCDISAVTTCIEDYANMVNDCQWGLHACSYHCNAYI